MSVAYNGNESALSCSDQGPKKKEAEVKDSEVKEKSRDHMSIVLSGKVDLKRSHNV